MSQESQSKISFFAKTNYRNQNRIFGIKEDDRRRHMYLIGKSGMGKTNLLENLAIQDIKHGKGIAFVDPHGDSAEKLIKAIPADRINDVIYFNPADQEYPIAFNVMEKVGAEYRHLIASGLIGVFKKLWADSWGPRLEYILRNAILALLEYPGSTLLGVTRILVDKTYRERVVAKITDPVVRSFWVDEFTKWNDRVLQEVISPIQNKVGAFLTTSLIRNIIGQTTSSFDVRDVMDGEKILILNLAKGRVGEDASALLGAMMITKIQLAAMERVDMPEETRKDFYLYVDEFQNFATESFANILSEARKYRLDLILANQYITQIDETVSNAIFGNAGTIVSFRVGAADAEYLEKEFAPVFTANDLVNLPKYNVYLKLMIDGIAGDAFSATTLPPISLEGTSEDEAKVIAVSRERYASSKKDVEEKIRRWSGMLTDDEREELLRQRTAQGAVTPQQTFVKRASTPAPLNVIRPHAPVSREDGRKRYETPVPKVASAKQVLPRTAESAPPAVDADELKRTFETVMAVAEREVTPEATKPSKRPEPTPERVEEAEPAEPILYPAICDTCGIEIRVPFKPDGSRPTFCKDCFKDYQRAMANARGLQSQPDRRGGDVSQHRPVYEAPKRPRFEPKTRQVESRSFVSSERPLSLAQASLVAPKKFRPDKRKPDLGAVRNILGKAQGGDDRPASSEE